MRVVELQRYDDTAHHELDRFLDDNHSARDDHDDAVAASPCGRLQRNAGKREGSNVGPLRRHVAREVILRHDATALRRQHRTVGGNEHGDVVGIARRGLCVTVTISSPVVGADASGPGEFGLHLAPYEGFVS